VLLPGTYFSLLVAVKSLRRVETGNSSADLFRALAELPLLENLRIEDKGEIEDILKRIYAYGKLTDLSFHDTSDSLISVALQIGVS